MKLLILGGTAFLGRHLVELALRRGHEVTLFNRGQRNPDLFSEVEQLRGDRNGHLDALRGRRWDAVIDTSGYIPRLVRDSATLLASAVEHYTFISSISVYAPSGEQLTEASPVGHLKDEGVEEITGETYGPLKALCEQAAEAALPGRTLVLRPGLIVGPHDPSDRFTYWPVRMARGGEILAPDSPDLLVQVIDVRDLAEWNLRLVEARATGIYNATGPVKPLTMGEVLQSCQSAAGSRLTWVSEEFLLAQKVGAFVEMPLWVPKQAAGMMNVNVTKAVRAGLSFRPIADTARDTLAWAGSRPADYKWRGGLAAEREVDLLKAWHAAQG